MEDYDEIYQFLVGSYPPGISKNYKRALRRKCKNFTVKETWYQHSKQVPRRREEISRILESCHASLDGGSMIKTNL